MTNDENFYSTIVKILLVFNILSLFFTFTLVLFYAYLEYVGLEFISISNSMFGSGSYWSNAIISLFELLLEIPGGLDTLFMSIIIVSIMNIFYLAYKSKKGGFLGFFFFISIGLPIWLWVSNKIVGLRNVVLNYLNSALIIKPENTFFDYFTMYSLEISAFIFIISLIINMIDWENVREKISTIGDSKISDNDEIGEVFEQ